MSIPMLDLSREIEMLWPELNHALHDVLHSGCFILGKKGQKFESEICKYLGVPHAIGVNSGTDALVMALKAADVGHGDEVITTAFTFFATAEAISQVGARPIFVDIDPQTYAIDPGKIEEVVTPRTRALLPVHLFGHSADMEAIGRIAKKHDLKVIEDVAQAFGGKFGNKFVGTFGDVATFSFYPTKNLGTYGDGGLVVTPSEKIAERVRMLRNHGARVKYYHEFLGYNSRLDEIHAAILLVKLPHVAKANQGRRLAAKHYQTLLKDIGEIVLPTESPGVEHVYHQYTIRVLGNRRDAVREYLTQQGVATMVYYPEPIHKSVPYASSGFSLPHTEEAAAQVLSLPMWPDIPHSIQEKISLTLKNALAHR